MNNQKGEVSLLAMLALVVLSGLILLCALSLHLSFSDMKKRTHLFLCTKETKGELNNYLKLMGRTNWAIKNAKRASLVMMFIPGLQGAAMNADRLKRMVKIYQNSIVLVSYLKKLSSLKARGCPIDPRMYITPFEVSPNGYRRDSEEAAKLRSKEWSYYFLEKPYALEVKIQANGFEAINPKINFISEEKPVKSLLRLFSSR